MTSRSASSRVPACLGYRSFLPGMLVVLVMLCLAGCQVLEPRQDPEPAAEPEADASEVDRETESPTLGHAIDLLQDGRSAEAEAMLETLASGGGGEVVQRLLDQIRKPPEALLGDDYIEVTVQAGDSLSGLAAEHVGDGLMFYALARLNGLKRPRLLTPGTTLRVPAPAEEPESVDTDQGLEVAAARMMAEGRAGQAYSLLLSAARAGSLGDEGLQQLVDASAEVAAGALAEGQLEDARRVLDGVQLWADRAPDPAPYRRQRARLDARLAMNAAERARLEDDREAERGHLIEALELDPGLTQAAEALARVEADLVERYHERALRAWRDQEVAEAARLWERVVEIDPEFEPAAVYLERAQAILSRLEEL